MKITLEFEFPRDKVKFEVAHRAEAISSFLAHIVIKADQSITSGRDPSLVLNEIRQAANKLLTEVT